MQILLVGFDQRLALMVRVDVDEPLAPIGSGYNRCKSYPLTTAW